MVAAFQVDANRQPVAGGCIERVNYDGDINGGVQIFGRDGDDTFVLDDNARADDDLRRRGRRHVPDRPGLRVARATARTRTTASRRATTSRPRRPRAASCRTASSQTHDALRRHRQRQLHRLPQHRRALPLRRGGRRHVHASAPSCASTRTTRRRRSPTSTAARAPTSSPTPSTRRCASTAATASTR